MATFAPLRLGVKIHGIALLCVLVALGGANAASAEEMEVESVVLRPLAEADVPAEEAGVLTSLPVREGQRMKRGELVAQIDDEVARMAEQAAGLAHQVARAKATNKIEIEFAHKAVEVAQAELKRSLESIDRFAKSVSQSQVDVERLTVEKSRLDIKRAEHQLRIAALEMNAQHNEWDATKVQVARRRIEAPIDGVVVQVFVRLGEWVEPGQPAVRIVDTSRLKAEGFLDAAKASADLVGAAARLIVDRADGTESTLSGKVAFVSPEIDPITGQVRVWVEVENRDGKLRAGQSVRMVIGE